MTLGSALPWRACSTLGRIQTRHRHRLQLSLATRSSLWTARHGGPVRTWSTASSIGRRPATPSSTGSADPPGTTGAAADESSSLIERLSRVPVRPHGTWDPVVLRPVTPYPHKVEDREGLQRNHRTLTQQARLESHRKQIKAGDWRVVLQNLIKWSPAYAVSEDGVKVIIPKQSVELLLSDHENNLWNIKSRTKCAMKLYRSAADDVAETAGEGDSGAQGEGEGRSCGEDMEPYILLSGQPAAISAAVDEIVKATKRVTIVKVQGSTKTITAEGQGGQPPAAGAVAAALAEVPIHQYPVPTPSRPYTLNMRVDAIPRPNEWNVSNFQRYVAAVTLARPHGSLGRRLYPGRESHIDTVVRLLHDVFNDAAASAAVSLPALKRALEHLGQFGETYARDAQLLLDRAETLGVCMDTDVYNMMAAMSVKTKNLLAFECTISDMVLRGHKPNARTWLLFLRIIEAEEVRRYILHAMHSKNLFSDPRVVNWVSVEMADHDIYRAVQLGQDVDTFLRGLRELYGPSWQLRTRAANRYLDVLGRYSKLDECRQLLQHMFASKRGKPNDISLNTVITHCKLQRKIDLAIEFVRMFDEQGCHLANDVTFHLLFEAARKTRKPHLLSAVWRYAHLVEQTTYRMRQRGIRLLAGGDELSHITARLRGLWEAPNGCKLSRQEFMENLLLFDYRVSTSKFKETLGREMAAAEKLSGQGDAPPPTPPPNPLLTSGSSQEGTEVTSGTRAEGDEQAKKPRHERCYDLYARWAFKKAQEYQPTTTLGHFLQLALDRDRRLHALAHKGVGEVRDGLPVDMHPVALPIQRLPAKRFVLNKLPGWFRKYSQESVHDDQATQGTTAPEIPGPRGEAAIKAASSLAAPGLTALGRADIAEKESQGEVVTDSRGRRARPSPILNTGAGQGQGRRRRPAKKASAPEEAWEELLRAGLEDEDEKRQAAGKVKATF